MSLPKIATRLLFALLALGPARPLAALASSGGVVVERVPPGTVLEKAGLRAGDLLLTWSGLPASGEEEIQGVFDWQHRALELAPRGPVRLAGRRGEERIDVEVPPGLWEDLADPGLWACPVRPMLREDEEATYRDGAAKIAAGDLEGGISAWRQIAIRAGTPSDLAAWILLRIGSARGEARSWEAAQADLRAALTAAETPAARVFVRLALGRARTRQGAAAEAEAAYLSALGEAREAFGDGLLAASIASGPLSVLWRESGRFQEAAQENRAALSVVERLAPESLVAAEVHHNLGAIASLRGDLEEEESEARKALDLRERLAPDTILVGRSLVNLALYHRDLDEYPKAEELLRRARDLYQRIAPEGLGLAWVLSGQGAMALKLGDYDAAEDFLRQAVAIRERVAPGQLQHALDLINLALAAQKLHRTAEAEGLARQALGMRERDAPESQGVALSLAVLGSLALERGDLDAAESLQGRALALVERLVPGSQWMAEILLQGAEIALRKREPRRSLALAERSLAIQARLGPHAGSAVQAHQNVGLGQLRLGRTDLALAAFERGLETLEIQAERLTPSPVERARYRAKSRSLFLDVLGTQLRAGRAADAFHTLERSRARELLNLIAERDLAQLGAIPAELEDRRRRNDRLYDRAQAELAQLGEASGPETSSAGTSGADRRAALAARLTQLRGQRTEIDGEIRRSAPQLAAPRYPEPLALEAARAALDPGTVAVAFAVGEERSWAFVLSRNALLHVFAVPRGEARLQREVAALRARIAPATPGEPLGRGEDPAFREPALDLYRALLAPAERWTRGAERLLLLPDGPLHGLPFAALIRQESRGRARTERAWRYLGDWKPLHSAHSLTLYSELRRSRRTKPAATLVAFGDPKFPTPPTGAGSGAGTSLRQRWDPLPQSRVEVEQIAALYPQARIFLGERATEEEAKGVREADVLHFATHSVLDDRRPLDSALVLSLPAQPTGERENGLFQAWEIFDRLRLPTDLVVLSACESALGRESSGEGLVGLTRAFQYAGARTVASSLWSVSDQATAELMIRFHRHLAAGEPKDRALQAAQRELLAQPLRTATPDGRKLEIDASAPYYWGAFQLLGDWR